MGSQVAEAGVALEHGLLGGEHLVHLEVVVHERHGVDAGLLGRPRRGGQDRGDRTRRLGPVEADEVEPDARVRCVAPLFHGSMVAGVVALCRGGRRRVISGIGSPKAPRQHRRALPEDRRGRALVLVR